MKKFWGRGFRDLLLSACLKGTAADIVPRCYSFSRSGAGGISATTMAALVLFIGFIAVTGRAQTSFYTPLALPQTDWGSTNFVNTGVTADTNCPTIAGNA